jgi:hypothetical protein
MVAFEQEGRAMLAEKIVLGIAALNLTFLISEVAFNVLRTTFG